MAKTFKSSPFENIVKKYTLCGICDGKIIHSSFLQCGCSVILCNYCNEKHSCKFHHQAVKFDSYQHNKSVNFIHELSALMTTNPSEKDKEKKSLPENSYSASLPDLDDLMVDETTNGEISFSQLFDDRCSRNDKPKNTISSIRRESISPRISYTLKRKQYLSDSEDEESFNKSETVLYKRLSDCSSSKKKKITKKMKYSNKSRDTSIFSPIGCDSDSGNSDKQPFERKRNNRKDRHSIPLGMSFGVDNDVSSLDPNEDSSPVSEWCQTFQESNAPLKDHTYLENNSVLENNSSFIQDLVKEKNMNNVSSSVENMVCNDQICANNIGRTIENSRVEENIDELHTCSLNLDSNEINTSNLVNDINSLNQIIKKSDEKQEINSNRSIKQRNSTKKNKESKCHKNKAAKSDKQIKHKDNGTLNCNLEDFDGFDQGDINASTLNYMLHKLTTPFNDDDEMMFPIHYKGKTFIIHLKDKFDSEPNESEYHYVLRPFKTFQNHFAQTEPQAVKEAKGDVITQTEGYGTAEACVGRDGEKTAFIQTDDYQVMDACVGRDGENTGFSQTDSYQMVDACAGPEAKISEVSQTDRYQVRDSYTNTKEFRCCAVQTNLVNNSSSDLWSRNCTASAVQTEPYENKASDISFNMPYSSVDLNYTCNKVENIITTEIPKKVDADAKENSDNEDEDIIEGTPVKVNNVSVASLNLSALKGRTPHFDCNESTVARDEIISCSDLTNADKLCVEKFTNRFGMEYSEYFNNKTTHLVVSSRLTHDSHKTFKYLIAIASKACVVSIDWVKDSLQRMEVLPVSKYIPTNQSGPMRCRMNVRLPFAGLTICVQLLTNYPGVKAMEALTKLCGAYIVDNIEQYNSPQKWPFPRFCLFEDETQLTSQILNSCSKNHLVAVHFEWVFDSVAAYCRQPILKYLCSTFIITDNIVEKYKIPSDMLVDNSTS
ncbi:unnamed protein product [Nezara viridula]|uniref:BRCT domain-containing protein n=1 Tax=Nezara viridula TaxID=85310 RepID=A0A9P0HGU4_NEZVI|nr:unnamed protein product [Nezara viridula]